MKPRRFKHIPTGGEYILYPGGTRVHPTMGESGSFTYYIPLSIVESGKDWEEIKEEEKPSYTILSLKGLSGSVLGQIAIVTNGLVGNPELSEGAEFSIQNVLTYWVNEYKSWEIHSVRRESDGEVFTIGDKFETTHYQHTLTGFRINNQRIDILFSFPDEYSYPLEEAVKVKKPIFITQDGVEIYDGDSFYWVNGSTFQVSGESIAKSANIENPYNPKFKNKKAAEEYIRSNKPCLSLKEVYDIANQIPQRVPVELLAEISKLVTSKLK